MILPWYKRQSSQSVTHRAGYKINEKGIDKRALQGRRHDLDALQLLAEELLHAVRVPLEDAELLLHVPRLVQQLQHGVRASDVLQGGGTAEHGVTRGSGGSLIQGGSQ